jgi:membrane-associated protease RseP (regulator of RpoE activity)
MEIAVRSPVASAGLQTKDRIVSVNGAQVHMENLRELLAQIKPDEPVTLNVKRNGQDLRLEYKGEIPTLEGLVVLDWQFVSAPVFLVLLLLLIATGPMEPPPLWRGILVALGGLAVVTVALVVEVTHWLPWTIIWQSQAISHGPSPPLHYALLIAVLLTGLALAFCGALSVRATLLRRVPKPATPNPLAGSEQAFKEL